MDSQTLAEFKVRLAQTIYWCKRHLQFSLPSSCLRTPELRPRVLEENRRCAVESVSHARELHGGLEIRKISIPDNLDDGRLLVYFPDFDLACGAAELETDGYFDVNNVPPWDTWVTYIQDSHKVDLHDTEYLVSWVPPEFVALADKGVHVNPEQCI